MKKAISISLALLLLILSARDLLTFAAFKLHQDIIVAELCVNIADPVPMCLGSCFLGQQIAEDVTEDTSPFTNWLPGLQDKPVYFQAFSANTPGRKTEKEHRSCFHYQKLQTRLFTPAILQPPQG
jgi:hypothetical protein